jgi:formate dehydrogenase subunit gamma
MSTLLRTFRLLVSLVGICGLALVATPIATPAFAQQQPSTVNPTADAVKEDQLLNQLRIINGRGTIPDVKSYNLEQPGGRDWRHFQEVVLPWIGAISILGMLVLLVVFYLIRGMVRMERGRSGRTIVRFNSFERFVHWMTATCFIILAITGLNITFGRKLLLPLMSADAFTAWSQAGKYAHNFLSFPFTLGVILIFLMWIAWNLPSRDDVEWLKEGGGMVGNKHPPAGHFNAGQKMIYWIVVLGGGAMAATGYMLMFPFALTDVAGMQTTAMVHGVVAVLFVAVMIAHAYIGTIGMEGAFEAMGTGTVDLNWAKQHHNTWVEEEVAKGRGATPPSGATATPAE